MHRNKRSLKRVIEASDDMSIDVPKISTYLGQIIAPLFNEHFSLGFLKPAIEPVRELKLCAEIIAEALRLASERLGHNTVTTLFKASNLKLDDFLEGVEDKREFIVQNKLEWMNGQNCEKSLSNISAESYETSLNQILASYKDNTDIFDQIEK
ncbi:eukaryotic translation initiation factor 4 gamma 3-like isoform X1, partial [Brachionus plicatilis]